MEEQTRQIIRCGLEKGINFYDTAIAYQAGTSEMFVGKALKEFAKREDVVVATKFLPRSQAEIEFSRLGREVLKTLILYYDRTQIIMILTEGMQKNKSSGLISLPDI